MDAKPIVFFVTFLLASFLISNVFSSKDEDCTYVVYIKTGDIHNAGTEAVVTLELKDIYLNRVNITNLSSHGVMRKHHDYFEKDNLDAFAIKAKCLNGPVCSMALSHDNSGSGPSWFVEDVDVTTISPRRDCRKTIFPVNGWLDVERAPYKTRVGVYLCDEIVHLGCKLSFEN